MKVYYFDTSAVLAVLFRQGPYLELFQILTSTDNIEILSSALFEAEALASVYRERLNLPLALPFLERVSLVFVDRSMTSELHKLLESQYCRGADAFHVATALYLDPKAEDLIFVTLDDLQRKVAASVGFRCWKAK